MTSRLMMSFVLAALFGRPAELKRPVTYSQDVAPILSARCAGCHRRGDIAPMSLETYEEVRPWAKAIREQVLSRRMPPWPADSRYGQFANSCFLSKAEIKTLVSWVDEGALKGLSNRPAAVLNFVDGWKIGKPDTIIDIGTDFMIPATGALPEQAFRVSTVWNEDRWVVAAEIRPGDRRAVHHLVVTTSDPSRKPSAGGMSILSTWAPGDPPFEATPESARLLPAGSIITFEIHYTPIGQVIHDRTQLALKFAQVPPKFLELVSSRDYAQDFVIPPGQSNYELKMDWMIKETITVTGWMPHMHLRGKDFRITIIYPDGAEEVSLLVPRFDWHWQIFYRIKKPLVLPAGTCVRFLAHYDNSANNRNNPDPTSIVGNGPQSSDEMMTVIYSHIVPNNSFD
jgi:hypothetical protein